MQPAGNPWMSLVGIKLVLKTCDTARGHACNFHFPDCCCFCNHITRHGAMAQLPNTFEVLDCSP